MWFIYIYKRTEAALQSARAEIAAQGTMAEPAARETRSEPAVWVYRSDNLPYAKTLSHLKVP